MDKQFIQNRYASIRMAHQISARKLSLELGQSSEYINQIENGKSMPSIENLLNFCDYFGITPSEFFDETLKYPIQYKNIINELNQLSPDDCELIFCLLKSMNRYHK